MAARIVALRKPTAGPSTAVALRPSLRMTSGSAGSCIPTLSQKRRGKDGAPIVVRIDAWRKSTASPLRLRSGQVFDYSGHLLRNPCAHDDNRKRATFGTHRQEIGRAS